MNRMLRVGLLLALLLSAVFLASCERETTERQVVDCPKVLFDCGNWACKEECGAIATDRGWLVLSSEAVNEGSGCLCEFEKV